MTENEQGKKTRSNQRQIDLLIKYMGMHPEFAAGRFLGAQGARSNRAIWEKLTEQLAEIGPAKSTEQWKTTWRDLKFKSRARNARRAALRTGNTMDTPVPTDNTMKVLNIISRATSEGSGLPESSIEPEEVFETEYDEPSTSTIYTLPSRPLTVPPVQTSSDSGLGSRAVKRKRTALPDSVGKQVVVAQETNNEIFKELVGVVKECKDVYSRVAMAHEASNENFKDIVEVMKGLGDILKGLTDAYVERTEVFRQQKTP